MSEQHNGVRVKRTDGGDLEMAMHALAGIFATLDAINDGALSDVMDERKLLNTEHSLIIAGRIITEDCLNRL